MKIFLDTADVDQIGPAYETGLIDGITTNPSLILRSGKNPVEVIKEIAAKFPNLSSISAEVVAETQEEMLKQAEEYYSISPSITIKVPCTVEGLKACKLLSDDGIQVNVTLVFSVSQAILANIAGATYISPFVGRWFDQSIDGIDLIKNIRKAFDMSSYSSSNILAASIRDLYQVEKCAMMGADILTLPPIVFWSMYKNTMTDKGLDQFQKDWEEATNV
jgi:transaldolase